MISAVVHTYNEEKNIGKCLSSLSWVNEIVVIDMGSTDQTCLIAKDYKARIYQHPYTGFVEPARNFGILKASGEWIIVVDADEEIPKSLAKYLSLEIQKPSADFYRIARKNIIFGKWIKHTNWWPDRQIRFYKKEKVVWNDKIHLYPQVKGRVIDLPAKEELAIEHLNYEKVAEFLSRQNRYSEILAQNYYDEGQRFSWFNFFWRPKRIFLQRYLRHAGFLDGFHGFALSILAVISQFAAEVKLWEKTRELS